MTKKALVLTPAEFKRLLKVIASSPYAKRDTLMVLMSYGLGLRAIELAALKVRHVIDERGQVRSIMRLTKTKGGEPRDAYLSDPKLIKAIEDYISERKETATQKRKFYSPEQPLFLSRKKDHFSNKTICRRFATLYLEAGI